MFAATHGKPFGKRAFGNGDLLEYVVDGLDMVALLARPDVRSVFERLPGAHRDLGIELVSVDDGEVRMRLPAVSRVARRAASAAVHAGAVITTMDSAMGLAVLVRLSAPSSLATLELRYDELREPIESPSIFVAARCAGIFHDVAYVDAVAKDDEGDFARCVARFVITGGGDDFMAGAMRMLAGDVGRTEEQV